MECQNPKGWVEEIIYQTGADPDKVIVSSRYAYNRAELIFTVRPMEDDISGGERGDS